MNNSEIKFTRSMTLKASEWDIRQADLTAGLENWKFSWVDDDQKRAKEAEAAELHSTFTSRPGWPSTELLAEWQEKLDAISGKYDLNVTFEW